jgi:hypothetical protein
MKAVRKALLGFIALSSIVGSICGASPLAHAYCRTTTCPLPADYDPTQGCIPPGLTSCTDSQGDAIKNIPLWWKSLCTGYSVQQDASRYVSLSAAENSIAAAFSAWTGASCSNGTPGISVSFLGPVACTDGSYKTSGPNQNALLFRDSGWTHRSQYEIANNLASPEIALTTMSFDPTTGEIYAGYIEINTADHVVVPTSNPTGNTFDLQTVLTHETGHFLGMAHSAARDSVMYFADREGTGSHRTLSSDDVAGVCAAYPPGGARIVDTTVDPSGKLAATACDATPRHGFSTNCATDTKSGCACSSAPADAESGVLAFGIGAAICAFARRRARSQAGER